MDSDTSDLNLSCESSDFSDSNFVDDNSDDGHIRPYQFEPEYGSDESGGGSDQASDADQPGQDENRLASLDWCRCGNCVIMGTAMECVCCQEIPKTRSIVEEFDDAQCITLHPGFDPVCLNVYTLRVAYLQYRQQYGDYDHETHE